MDAVSIQSYCCVFFSQSCRPLSRKLYTATTIAVISALFLNLRFNLQPREVAVTPFAAVQFAVSLLTAE